MNQNILPMFKFIVIGDRYVGKTSFIKQYSESKFDDIYKQTLPGEGLVEKIVVVDKTKVKLQIWDTAGEERFHSLNKLNFQKAQAAFLVYDVTNRETFNNLDVFLKQIEECAPENIIKILVGNKSDEPDEKRQVSQQEAKKFSTDYGFDHYFETSAKSGENVEKVFVEAVKSVIVRMYMRKSQRNSLQTNYDELDSSSQSSRALINNPPQTSQPIRLNYGLEQEQAIPQLQEERNNWCSC